MYIDVSTQTEDIVKPAAHPDILCVAQELHLEHKDENCTWTMEFIVAKKLDIIIEVYACTCTFLDKLIFQYIEKIAMAQDHVKSVKKRFCKPFHYCDDRIVLQIPTIHDKNGWSLLPLAEENSVSICMSFFLFY